MEHRLQIKNYGNDRFVGKCACRQQTKPLDYRQEVEDWHRAHLAQVERARTGLGTKTPTLLSQLKHYRAMEGSAPKRDRPYWKQLADELEARLHDDPYEGMEPLFAVETSGETEDS